MDFGIRLNLIRLVSIVTMAVLCTMAATVYALPIQYRITGTIDVQFQVGPLPPGIFQGAPYQAILSYDLTTPDSRPDDPQRGFYSTANVEDNFLLIQAGASEIHSDDPLSLFVGDDIDNVQEIFELPDDTFGLRDVAFSGNFEHSSIALMAFRWNDPNRLTFSSDALPTSLDLAQFTQPFIEVRTFQFDSRSHQFRFRAVVDSIHVIPEPTTLSKSMIAVVVIFTGCFRLRRLDDARASKSHFVRGGRS